MIQLRQYQTDLKNGVYSSWQQGHENVVAVAPTGAGKTATMASMAVDFGEPTAAIAHRQELVQQISIAMARMDLPHRIVAPDKVVSIIIQQHIKECGMSYVSRDGRMSVTGVDTLIRRKDDRDVKQWANTIRYWEGDECFPAGTLVDGTPIECISVGDVVTAFDERTGLEHRRQVTAIMKNPMPEWMCTVRAGMFDTTCTFGHPFWTQRGWVVAGELTRSDSVMLRGGMWTSVIDVSPTRGDGDFVYNLEVEGLHTYFANGIAVHNCHHFLSNNKWGTAVAMFPNARGVGFTASPIRCDRKSLHVDQGGVFSDMVIGPTMRELIDMGFLADYQIYGPPQSINDADLTISKNTGEITAPSMKKAAEKSTLYGDIVEHYLRIAPGKRGITFVHDVDAATKVAAAFNAAGVPAAAVSAKTPDVVRNSVIDKFRRGELLQLINVDLFGEGFDVPAVEVVSMGRRTESLGLYIQQFGRALRMFKGKLCGIIIDHVGNVKRHGLPDAIRGWQLLAEEKGRRGVLTDPNVLPTTSCTACFRTYERIHKACPFCGHVEEPSSRSDPKFVDGDLSEYGPELLDELRKKAQRLEGDPAIPPQFKNTPTEGAIKRRHNERMVAREYLKDAISQWAGVRRQRGMEDSEIYRRFYHMFGVDIGTAQTLDSSPDIQKLTLRVQEHYWT